MLYVTVQPAGGVTAFHRRLAELLETDVTCNPVGVAGYEVQAGPLVVALTVLLNAETLPALSRARTANWKVVDGGSPVTVNVVLVAEAIAEPFSKMS